MKLRIMSDLHLEFDRAERKIEDYYNAIDNDILPAMPDDMDTVLILAGDIDKAKCVHYLITHIAHRFKYILMIMGNHEHYGGNFPTSYRKIEESTASISNFYLLDAEDIELDGIHF